MRAWGIVAAVVVSAAALAGDAVDLASIEGVYKERFDNGLVSGETFKSENVLEIVKLDPARAYVRTRLEFYNGHSCSLHAVGRLQGNTLVVRTHTEGASTCEMKLVIKDGKIVFDDSGDCRSYYCGARGSFDGTEFALSARRTIRYMARLKASREYAEALKEAGL